MQKYILMSGGEAEDVRRSQTTREAVTEVPAMRTEAQVKLSGGEAEE